MASEEQLRLRQQLRLRSRLPVVRRVRDLLRAEILVGGFKHGPLPSETELMVEYNASRGVVRAVLDLLRDDGLVERLQGAGTFAVAAALSPYPVDIGVDSAEEHSNLAANAVREPLQVMALAAPRLVASRLGVSCGSDVVFLERRSSLLGKPFSTRSSWFPYDVGARLLEADEVELTMPVYELIELVLGCPIGRIDVHVEACVADYATAPLLEVREGMPLLLIERTVLDPDGRVIELAFARVRSDRMFISTVSERYGDHTYTSDQIGG